MVTVCDFEDEPVEGLVGAVGELVVEGLVAHVLAEHARVGSEPRDRHADVVLHLEDLVLVAGQLRRQLLQTAQHNELAGAQAETDRALLDRLHRVLHLEELALRRPGRAVEVVQSLQH
jgi:hypothetical protein